MMQRFPLVSIVMLAWNRKDDVRESLRHIQKIDYEPLEIIVVDNASDDGTAQMVEAEFPDVHLIKMKKNIGIAAYNVGFEQAKGKYIVIIDDDSFPARHAIRRMVQVFEKDERLGAVAFDVRNYDHYDEIKNELEDTDETEEVKAVASDYLMSFNGAGVGIRKDLFKKIGYYPEEFFLYYNEMDCAFKIWNAGYRIEFYSNIVSYHKYSPKNRASWRAPFYYTRNAFWLIWKHYPMDMALNTTLRLIYHCLYYSIEQKTTVYLKAMWSAFREAYKLKGKRKAVDRAIAQKLRVPFNLSFTFYR
ncbi:MULTISPECIES: glycosyltransferase family 2 protein [Geobacillus]|uniref:Glycosyl transferase n=1 Tax=Geobacillus thermocatenulatus TaxID=33938 RepID=A0A226QAM5_9BACL|nr:MULTISPECIES: glycosyltransferase family 2 protein [Geobacillus]ASS98190.1 glycosyl transferase [Geobacillus thermocatenulatus]KLR74381.1 glycosyl transferase [Geobacillus sp. T6]OXB88948.1 glycosyl transferase [Geobacillus thermocatenulatus]